MRVLASVMVSALALTAGMAVAAPPEFQTLQKPEASHELAVTTVAEGLDHPWDIAFMPDGRILVTERTGNLRVIKNGKLVDQPIQGLPEIEEVGQGGLLSVKPHPDYAQNRLVYLTYAEKDPEKAGHRTVVARFKDQGDSFTDGEVIFRGTTVASRHHFGSRMAFGPDGKLYFTIGERGQQDRAQDTSDPSGAVLRINDDGSIPEDNPFVGREGYHPALYSIGNRNPQGLSFEPGTGALWSSEHGPQGGDEMNIIRPGANYGWPVITYGRTYGMGLKIGEGTEKEGMAQPEIYFVPSLAVNDITFIEGDAFPAWKGDILMALLAGGLVRLDVENGRIVGGERLLEDELGRTRDVAQGPDGALYALIDDPAPDGKLIRIERK